MEYIVAQLVGALIGCLVVLAWALRPVWVDLYRHGFDNHRCRRECCRRVRS